jgi:hypothetical protein
MELTLTSTDATDYDFAEVGQDVTSGDAAPVGYWQSKGGRELINAVNNDLAAWLASNFSNVFGDVFDSTSVADFYQQELFKQKGQKTAKPSKVDAHFMAVAMSTFVTSQNLSGSTIAAGYGFNVTDTGLGSKTVNVGDNGAAFNVADNTDAAIMQLLLATNDLTDTPDYLTGFAHTYDEDGDGIVDAAETLMRQMAGDVYAAINNSGEF